jgi:hypothetical protein
MADQPNNKANIALAKIGMIKDTHPSQLNETQYSHAFNANVETESGNSLNITNERSNMLITRYKPGFVVIGYENDLLSNHTYVFLVNPSNGIGEFGYIEDNQNVINLQDITALCGNGCDEVKELATPLEQLPQIPLIPNAYHTLISDACALDMTTTPPTSVAYTTPTYQSQNLGFNFDKNYPIKKVVIKNEKSGKSIYFTDNFNPPRHIDITNIEDYFIQNVPCQPDFPTPGCIDFDELRIFKLYQIPEIKASSLELGGRLKMGTYQFLIAYADAGGNEISPYYSITQPIAVFDKNNNILEQPELADRTNYAIKLDVTNLDKRYTHYKVVVIQTADIEGTSRYFVEGLHTINDNVVLYTTEQNKISASADMILIDKLHVERTEGMTASNNTLFQYGIDIKEELNLQPVVNFLGQFLKWQTTIGKEDLYDDGVLGYQNRGYNRDEIVPFSIRFLLDGGYETAIYPFISRVPKPQDPLYPDNAYDFEELVSGGEPTEDYEENSDVNSILQNKVACNSTQRVYRWQYYNTAEKDEGFCESSDEIPTETVFEEITRICETPLLEEEQIIPSGLITIPLDNTEYTDLTDYINFYSGECDEDPTYLTSDDGNVVICDYLTQTYPEVDCNANGELFEGLNCDQPGDPECVILVDSIEDEVTSTIPKIFPSEYALMTAPKLCQIYKIDYTGSTPGTAPGGFKKDINAPLGYANTSTANDIRPVYERDSDFQNEICLYAKDVVFNPDTAQNNGTSYFNNYKYSADINDLLTAKTTTPFILTSTRNFNANLHTNALWFKGKTEGLTEFIIDISKQRDSDGDDDINIGNNTTVRMSIFKKCTDSAAIYSALVNLSIGEMFYIKKVLSSVQITQASNPTPITLPAATWFNSGEYFITIDTPINLQIVDIDSAPNQTILVGSSFVTFGYDPQTRYITTPTDGCYTVSKRNPENSRVEVTWEKIYLKKFCTYKTICQFEQPIAQSCKVFPFEKGKFAYWESTEKYPDNPELFDSSTLKINKDKWHFLESQGALDSNFLQEFEDVFTDNAATINGNYLFKTESWNGATKKVADFTCRNIRHFKFPDNHLSPFMYDLPQAKFGNTVIFPLGVTIDETIINLFLDIAVDNELLTQSDRDKIVGYEIFRGDITLDRSIVASGLLYDMRKYRETENVDKDILYSNYPYNTFAAEKFNDPYSTETNRANLGEGATFGVSNRHYTFHSPETDYTKVGLPSEVSFQGYQYGNSRGSFDQVKQHPKWVILSERAYTIANSLAIAEVVFELLIQSLQALSNANIIVGFANTAFPGGVVASIAIAAIGGISGAYFQYGRYRYEWLKTFRDLGTPHNFAYYYFSEGFYNYVRHDDKNLYDRWIDEGNKLRAINIGKYLGDGRYIVTNENTGERLSINNIDREKNVFLSFGKFFVEYPADYKNYDKSLNDSSMTYLGENNILTAGRSQEIIKNVASPYAALKNYLPTQYGTLNSVKWLSTGYRGNLRDPQVSCISIFGGDTFITRHTLKRKMSQFLVTAMKQADLTPYNYYFYNNIGRRPRFYVSYEENKDFGAGSKALPDIRSDFNFDTPKSSGNYFVPPSKFYLYHYGVPNFLTETRINTAYRYSGKEKREGFYPQVGDLGEWTQETNVPIREPNIFKYNSAYSNQTIRNRTRTIPEIYNKKLYDVIQNMPNGIIASLPDNSETSSYDPWLIYNPADTYEFPSNYGKLKDIIDTESGAILARFSDISVLYNKVDSRVDMGTAATSSVVNGKELFYRRPVTSASAKLGYGGTQNFTSVSCEAGHFWVDAKRGQVLMMPPNGAGLEEISTAIGGKPSGMRNWFKEHLPFKILKAIPNADIDNPYNGIGITMGWDSRYRRVFITKKDYLPGPCVQFIPGQGFVYNETLCGEDPIVTCPEGYTLSQDGTECTLQYDTGNLCPEGYAYIYISNDPDTSYCEAGNEILADCECLADVIATPQTICSGDTTSIALTSTEPTGIVYSWVVLQEGVNGGTAGNSIASGNTIAQELIATGTTPGTATYTITPYEDGLTGCSGTPVVIIVTVKPTPNIIAVPSSPQTITSGDTLNIALSSGVVGTTFTWTATASGVTGATSGSGSTITDTLTSVASGSVTYNIVATAPNGCTNTLAYDVNIGATIAECLVTLTARVFYDDIGNYTIPYTSRSITVGTQSTNGSGNIIINGTAYPITFITDATATATAFKNAHAAALNNLGILLLAGGGNITVAQYSDSPAPTVTYAPGSTPGNLAITVNTANFLEGQSTLNNNLYLPFATFANLPSTGQYGKVYFTTNTSEAWVWNGLSYVPAASKGVYANTFWDPVSSTVGHTCNRAKYNFMTNGLAMDCYHYPPSSSVLPNPTNLKTDVNFINLNNNSNSVLIDNDNVIVYNRTTSPVLGRLKSRESFATYSTAKSAILESGLSTSASTFKIRLKGTNIVVNPGTLVGTFYDQHSDVVGLQFFINGEQVYNGVIGSRVFEIDPCTFVPGQTLTTYESSTGGTSRIDDITIGTQTGTLTAGVAVTPSTVTQDITVTVTLLGTYDFIGYANGVTFRAKGTFTTLGVQTVTMEALGTPITAGASTFELDLAIPVSSYWRVPPTFNITVL